MAIVPRPSLERLVRIERLLHWEELKGNSRITSALLGKMLNVPGNTIRKDLSWLGSGGQVKQGYEVKKLRQIIRQKLKISASVNAAVVGLSNLGLTLLKPTFWGEAGIEIKAGFEDSINKLETINATVPLYPEYELKEKVEQLKIELVLLSVTDAQHQQTLERLKGSMIKGIINLTTRILPEKVGHILIRNIDLGVELKLLQARINQEEL